MVADIQPGAFSGALCARSHKGSNTKLHCSQKMSWGLCKKTWDANTYTSSKDKGKTRRKKQDQNASRKQRERMLKDWN